MNFISKLINKTSKNILIMLMVIALSAAVCYGIVWAVSAPNGSSTSAERELTSEEIDKIISDLKVSGNIDNILEKLDEIIQRAQLSGNTALLEYATNQKQIYELQKELDSAQKLNSAMVKKNSDIAAVDEQISKIFSVTTVVEDLRGAVSNEALMSLQSLSEENLNEFKELFHEISAMVDLNDVNTINIRQRALLDVLVLNFIIENDMLEGDKLQTASDTLNVAVTILESYSRDNYSGAEYSALTEETNQMLKLGKKVSAVSPEQIVFMMNDGNIGSFNIKNGPISYNGHILLALEDLYQYIDSKVEYMYNNATIVIKSVDPKTSQAKIVEIRGGENVAYVDDKPLNMPVAIMNFNNKYYISAESFAEIYGISYKYLPSSNFIVLYKNLVQLSNPSVANNLVSMEEI